MKEKEKKKKEDAFFPKEESDVLSIRFSHQDLPNYSLGIPKITNIYIRSKNYANMI